MAITIPGRLRRFLEQHANLAFAGTRSPQLVPCGHRVSGWFLDESGSVVTALVPALFTTNLIEFLQDNGHFALTVEEFPSHETYQFKGRYLSHRSVEPDDLLRVDRIRQRFVKTLRQVYGDAVDQFLTAYIQAPVLAVAFEIHEIFLQTPGPGAGTRLVPPVETVPV